MHAELYNAWPWLFILHLCDIVQDPEIRVKNDKLGNAKKSKKSMLFAQNRIVFKMLDIFH